VPENLYDTTDALGLGNDQVESRGKLLLGGQVVNN
jgi:hypothetical protein